MCLKHIITHLNAAVSRYEDCNLTHNPNYKLRVYPGHLLYFCL